MGSYLSIGEASNLLGVHVSTLRRWEQEGVLYPKQMVFWVGAEHSKCRSVYQIHDCVSNAIGNTPEESSVKGMACYRTPGGHRRYNLHKLEKNFLNKECHENPRKTIAYARVSSHDQKLDLARQEKRLQEHCRQQVEQVGTTRLRSLSELRRGLSLTKAAYAAK